MIISITDIIVIVICISLTIIFFIFINRDKFSLNCHKKQTIDNNIRSYPSIKFDDESNFEDNIKLISNVNKKYENEKYENENEKVELL